MTRNAKGGSLLLAGLAAFAYYKYSKLSDEDKKELISSWKEKGKHLLSGLPLVSNLFGKHEEAGMRGSQNSYAL